MPKPIEHHGDPEAVFCRWCDEGRCRVRGTMFCALCDSPAIGTQRFTPTWAETAA